MTKKEAINKLNWALDNNSIEDVQSAYDYIIALKMAIKALEQEPTTKIEESNFSQEQYLADIQSAYDCGYAQGKNDLGVDCISRADAIQAMQDKAKKLTNEDTINGLCGAVAILFDLPSVTPQEPRWIPTSERLPEEDGEYYATVYDTDENYKYMDIAELENGIWQYKDYIKVLAWMPLPKSYSEVEK